MWLINSYDLLPFFDRKDFSMTENDILLTDRESAKLLHMSVPPSCYQWLSPKTFKIWFFVPLVTIGSYQCHRASKTATSK